MSRPVTLSSSSHRPRQDALEEGGDAQVAGEGGEADREQYQERHAVDRSRDVSWFSRG